MSEVIFAPKSVALASMVKVKTCKSPAVVDLSMWTKVHAHHVQLSGPASTTLITASHSHIILRAANVNTDPLLHLGDL